MGETEFYGGRYGEDDVCDGKPSW